MLDRSRLLPQMRDVALVATKWTVNGGTSACDETESNQPQPLGESEDCKHS